MTSKLETVEDLVAAGKTALARSDWAEARRCFESALAGAESVDAWEGLAWAASWLGDTDASLAAREQAFRAKARSLSDAQAENAARIAVAPEPVVDLVCFRVHTRGGKPEKRRALCLVGRPGPSDLVCDSVVEVTVPRGRYGAISTHVTRLDVCMPPHDRTGKSR